MVLYLFSTINNREPTEKYQTNGDPTNTIITFDEILTVAKNVFKASLNELYLKKNLIQVLQIFKRNLEIMEQFSILMLLYYNRRPSGFKVKKQERG